MDFDDEATTHEPKTNGANNGGNNINLASMSQSSRIIPIISPLYFIYPRKVCVWPLVT